MKIKYFGMVAGILLTLLNFSSCATPPTESDCTKINWFELGEKQALKGKKMNIDTEIDSTLGQYCRAHFYSPNEKDFQEGYKMGLRRACTFENGVLMGDAGKQILQNCPIEMNQEYSRGYIEGKDRFTLRQGEQERAKLERERQDAYFEGMKEVIRESDENRDTSVDHARTYPKHNRRCVDKNIFGKYEKGGGCNTFGCWPAGGGCNTFGCSEKGSCSATKCMNKIVGYRCIEN